MYILHKFMIYIKNLSSKIFIFIQKTKILTYSNIYKYVHTEGLLGRERGHPNAM
jgi:hypothetical protein